MNDYWLRYGKGELSHVLSVVWGLGESGILFADLTCTVEFEHMMQPVYMY